MRGTDGPRCTKKAVLCCLSAFCAFGFSRQQKGIFVDEREPTNSGHTIHVADSQQRCLPCLALLPPTLRPAPYRDLPAADHRRDRPPSAPSPTRQPWARPRTPSRASSTACRCCRSRSRSGKTFTRRAPRSIFMALATASCTPMAKSSTSKASIGARNNATHAAFSLPL